MSQILRRASSNYLKRHRGQLALTMLGIALGVAVVVSVELAKSSALEAFDQAVLAVAGRATHRISGGTEGLNEQVYVQLRRDGAVGLAAPRVEGVAATDDGARRVVRILGVDPFAERAFQSDWYQHAGRSGGAGSIDLTRLIIEPGTVLVTDETARRLGVELGQSLSLLIGTQRKEVTLSGIFSPRDSATEEVLNDLLITDIASAQELLGMIGRLSHVDLIVPWEGADAQERLDRIRALLPEAAELTAHGSGQRSVREMTRAFYTNLTALSILSLLVGMFLVYNTMTFLVVQRRELIGGLRALGVTRRQIIHLILSEAALIGLIATLVGVLIGIVLSHFFLELISKTLNQAFFFQTSPGLSVSRLIVAKGVVLGVGATVVSAALPAVEAARYSPLQVMRRSQIETRTRALLTRTTLGGIVVLAAGIAVMLLPTKSISMGFIGQLVLVLGFALMTPILTVFMMAVIRPLLARLFGVIGYLPARFVTASLSRTGVAVSALMVAVAVSIGLQLMVGNFRLSVFHWLSDRLDADLYVSMPAPASSGSAAGLSAELKQRIAALPGVEALSTVRRIRVRKEGTVTRVNAYEMVPSTYAGFRFVQGSPERIWPAFEQQDVVIVTDSFAWLHDIHVGDALMLRTDSGDRPFRVVGVYTDYNTGSGIVSMSRRTFERHWRDRRFSGIGVYAGQEGVGLERLRREIETLGGPGQLLQVTLQQRIIERSMEIFDQAFAITDVLRWLAATIAFVAVFSALMAIQLERRREFGILRANGVTPGQLRRIIYTETGLMGLVAGVLALPLAICIAATLIFVINRRSFGWRMEFALEPGILVQGLGLAVLAALLAGIVPAVKLSRLSPAEALRTE
jgi:putative ABC transport system permease protein